MSDQDVAWRPSPEVILHANWTRFMQAAGVPDYESLLAKAESEPQWFWDTLIRYLDYRFSRPYACVLDLSGGREFPRWCVGGRTNVVHNALDRQTTEQRGMPAVIWEAEDGATRRWTYGELDAQTCRFASGIKALGLDQGDVVGLYMPMVPETLAAFWGLAKLGCVVLPLFSGFAADAVAERLIDGGAVAVVTADITWRKGQAQEMKGTVDEATSRVPTLRHVIVVQRDTTPSAPMVSGRDVWWHELCVDDGGTAQTVEVDAEHPLMIAYTSGTTGKPKGIVHTHCGLPVKVAHDTQLSYDFKPGDRVLFMADFGWLAGPSIALGCALAGATFVMAEGVPDFPQPCRYWRLAQDQKVSIIGMAPTLARGLRRHGDAETDQYDLSSIRLVIVSGEACDSDTWKWVFQHIAGGKSPIMNLSGGTEIGGGIVSCSLLKPIKPGSVGEPLPGMGADIVDSEGHSVTAGRIGELVLRSTSIGLTRSFWKDRDRYLDTYWRQMPGLWVHGDLASRDEDGCWFLHGRSDDTIKVAGKRAGPAELEQILIQTRAVSDAAVVGIPDRMKGHAIVCVVVAAPGRTAGDALAQSLSSAIVDRMGSAFRPRAVLFVTDLPRTRTMKVMRRLVRSVITGVAPGDLSSLLNPAAVDELAEVVRGSSLQGAHER